MVGYEIFQASCPRCGAPVTDRVCPYCLSEIVAMSSDSSKAQRTNDSGLILSKGLQFYAGSACSNPELRLVNRCADDILSAYSKHSDAVYDFMERNGIGHSEFGRFMDQAAKGKHTIAHRLYGHHILYDFPIQEPKNIPPFLEHLFSDYFTKMGLPIVPGDILEDAGMLKWCNDLRRNWNFVNGFDVLSGTVALVQGIQNFQKCFSSEADEQSVLSLAAQIGIGTFELLISASTYNPFLLIGSLLTLFSGVSGLIKKGTRAYIQYNGHSLSISI